MAYAKKRKELAARVSKFVEGKRTEHKSAEKPANEQIGTRGSLSRFNKAPARPARASGDDLKDVY